MIAIRKNVNAKQTKILNRLSQGYRAIKPSHIKEGFELNLVSFKGETFWEYIITNEINGKFVVCIEATEPNTCSFVCFDIMEREFFSI